MATCVRGINNGSIPCGDPDSMTLFSWERDFNYNWWQVTMSEWWKLSVPLAATYVTLIYVGTQWMKNRQPYRLKYPLIVWNVALALFSAMGFWRTVTELVDLMGQPGGFHKSACVRDTMHMGIVFWSLMMALSKAVELGDTAFIVLRKQKLIFLHWYHHASVLMYCWYTYIYHDAPHRWFMSVNYGVHTIMYTYYALRAMGIKVPRNLSVMITFTQIAQMFVGMGVCGYSLYVHKSGQPCQIHEPSIQIILGIYSTYAVLFTNFFVKSYLQSGSKRKSE